MRKCLLLFLFIPLLSAAQPYFDVASVQTSSANHELNNNINKTSLSVNWLAANFSFPLKLNHSNLFVTTAAYEQFSLTGKSSELTQSFHSIYLPLTFLHTWKDTTWNTSFTLIPKVNSYSPIQISDQTFQTGGAIIGSHIVNSKFKYSFGLYYNREFFGNYFLPLAGIEWKPTTRLHIFGLLPNKLIADIRINKALHTGFTYKGLTTSFRYKPENLVDYLRMQEGQLKLFADLYITKSVVLNLEGGVIIARAYELQIKNSNTTHEFDVRESSIFKIGLYYRVWL